jgi:hypothetical protein
MPVVRVGNAFYVSYLILGVLMTLLLMRILSRLGDRKRRQVLFSILLFGLFLHVFKVFFPPYSTLDHPFRKLSLENICAVSTVFFPFIFLMRNKTLKDYMVMAGIVSGILAFVYPSNAVSQTFDGIFFGDKNAFSFEVIRFYVAHWIIFTVPYAMLRFKIHTLSAKRVLRPPMILISVLFLIYINELVLTQLGWVPKEDLYNPEGRNPSLIFGIPGSSEKAGWILLVFVPAFLLVHPVTGEAFSWPVLWMVIPLFIYATVLSFLFVYITDREGTKTIFSRWLSGTHPASH